MSVDYNNFAKTFSNSRKKMKWEEIDYFLSFISSSKNLPSLGGDVGKTERAILDIGCGNGRFLSHLKEKEIKYEDYLGVDLSEGLLEEANYLHPEARFLLLNMLDLDKIKERFDYIFFIASFHHLDNIEDRKEVLNKAYNLLKKDGKIFMTNWSLSSELNKEKYSKSIIKDSENEFGSLDYNIKIGEFDRYYHCFDLKELEYLFTETGFKIIENREFKNGRNIISIIQKKGD